MSEHAPRREVGWTITPRTLGVLVSACALIAALWKPVQVGVQLSNSIDRLSTAVTQLQDLVKAQGEATTVLKADVAGLKALADARTEQLKSIDTRLQALEGKRQR